MRSIVATLTVALTLTLVSWPVRQAPSAARSAPAPARSAPAPAEVLVVGDSLAVGIRRFLGPLLAGRHLTWSVRSGITTPQGMQRLRAALRRAAPQTVVLSLGTNDGSDPRRFADRLARTLAMVPPGACVVWPAVHRAVRKGAYRPLNRVQRAAARADGRLTVVGWDRMVARGAVALPDGVHPDERGFRTRGRVIAEAVRRGCAG
jgi:lysophospholipase L1-like esterase